MGTRVLFMLTRYILMRTRVLFMLTRYILMRTRFLKSSTDYKCELVLPIQYFIIGNVNLRNKNSKSKK